MELSRNEVVAIYNNLKDANLATMSRDCQKAFIVNSIKLKPYAEKITEENTKIADSLRTEEYMTAFKEYVTAKDKLDKNNNAKTVEAFDKATKKFEPLFKDMEDRFNETVAAFEQKFEIDLISIPLESYLEYLEKFESRFTFKTLEILEKLLV